MKAGEQRSLVELAADWSRRFAMTLDGKSMGIRPSESDRVAAGCQCAMQSLQWLQENETEIRAWMEERKRGASNANS